MSKNKSIIFEIGSENRPQVEKINAESIQNSIFSEQYRHILNSLNRYADTSMIIQGSDKESSMYEQAGHINNIFAFLGDRGSGKTSCMLSVADFLLDERRDNNIIEELNLYSLSENKFIGLDLIDPSFFDNKHNILSIVVAKLYAKYKQFYKIKSESNSIDQNKHRLLLTKFSEVQRNLLYLEHEQNPEDDNLNQLYLMAAAVDLKNNISELTDAFFDFIDDGSNRLLLIVDDIDLNTQCADVMAEQIRKYFVHPNIIILISLKLSQFELIKRLNFRNDYNSLLGTEASNNDVVSSKDLDEMVESYLTKLLPHMQRIYMPDGDDYLDKKLTIRFYYDDEISYNTVKDAIPDLIFKKTRYLFYNSAQQVSYIVPRNLRELRQFVSLLVELNDYWDTNANEFEESKGKANRYNKELFQKYLFNNWAVENLTVRDRKIVEYLRNIEDSSTLNAAVIDCLRKRYSDFFMENETLMSQQDSFGTEIKAIISDRNRTYNYSVGDTISILYLLKNRLTDDEDIKLIFLIQTLISFRLYEYYDLLTEEYSNVKVEKIDESDTQSADLFDNSALQRISDYQKFVGGRFFNSRLVELLPRAEAGVSRSNRRIPVAGINALISLALETEDRAIIQLAEFFMLCTARRVDTKNMGSNKSDWYEPEFRRNSDITYWSDAGSTGWILFDVNSFLFNVCNIQHCFERFNEGGKFWSSIIKAEGNWCESLTNLFFLDALEFRQNISKPQHSDLKKLQMDRWLSLACLRNVEIIFDLYRMLDLAEYKTGDDIKIISEFFNLIGNYKIDLYSGKRPYYQIQYPFADYIQEVLSGAAEIFNFIYNESRELNTTRTSLFKKQIKDIYSNNDLSLEVFDPEVVTKGMKSHVTVLSLRRRLRRLYTGSLEDIVLLKIISEVTEPYSDIVSSEEISKIICDVNERLIIEVKEMKNATDK